LLFLCFGICFLFSQAESQVNEIAIKDAFVAWTAKYNKIYSAPERSQRYQNFKASLDRIAELNRKSQARGGATFGLNKFSDLTVQEFQETILMTRFNATPAAVKSQNMFPKSGPAAADAFDWRTKGAVTPVKDQAQCGSCWAFSVTENVESIWMLKKNVSLQSMLPLAPQQIVDCDDSDAGCNGGNPPTAYDYIKSAGGLEPEKDYPYKAVDQTCKFNRGDVYATISGYKYATSSGDETTLKSNLVSVGPLSICVDARYWQDYQSGVLSAWQCDWIVELDHCVQAVGYDLTASTPYWIVRNSWGTDWGEKGYILLQYGSNTCGLTEEATSATV